MALTKILEPQVLTPAYNDNIIIFDSDNKNLPGFSYVMDLTFTSPSVNKTLRLRAQPRAVDGYGVFEIGRIIQNYLLNEEPLSLPLSESQYSWVEWSADVFEEYISDEYISTNIQENDGNLVITTVGIPSDFNAGDFISLLPTESSPIIDILNFPFSIKSVTSFGSAIAIEFNYSYNDFINDDDVVAYLDEHTTLVLIINRILGNNLSIKEDTEVNIDNKWIFNGSEKLDYFTVRNYDTEYPNPNIDINTGSLPPFYAWEKYQISETTNDFGYEEIDITFKDWIGRAMTTQKPLLQTIENNWYEQPTDYKTRIGQSRALNFFTNEYVNLNSVIYESFDNSGDLIERRKTEFRNLWDVTRVNTGYWCANGSEFVSGTNSDSFETWNGTYQQFGSTVGILVSDITPFSIGQSIFIQVTPSSPAVAGTNNLAAILNISGNYIILSISYNVFNNNVENWEIANGTTISGNVYYGFGNTFITDVTSSYRVYLADNTNIPISQAYHYTIDREEYDYEEYQVYFLDRLGSIQSFSFYNKHKISFRVNREQSGKVIGDVYDSNTYWGYTDTDNSKPLLSINEEAELELTIAWLEDSESELFLDLLSSPIHYIRKVPQNETIEQYNDAKVESYTLNKNSFDKKNLFQDDNIEYTLKFKKNNNEIINW